MANTSALPESSTSVVAGQLAAVIALAAAFVLALTRLTLRRRSSAKPTRAARTARTAKAAGAAAQPDEPGQDSSAKNA